MEDEILQVHFPVDEAVLKVKLLSVKQNKMIR